MREKREKERAPRWTRCLSPAINVYNSKGKKEEREREKKKVTQLPVRVTVMEEDERPGRCRLYFHTFIYEPL